MGIPIPPLGRKLDRIRMTLVLHLIRVPGDRGMTLTFHYWIFMKSFFACFSKKFSNKLRLNFNFFFDGRYKIACDKRPEIDVYVHWQSICIDE